MTPSPLWAPFHCSQGGSVRSTLGWPDRGKGPGRDPWRPPCLEQSWMTNAPENLSRAVTWVRGEPRLPPSWATREDTWLAQGWTCQIPGSLKSQAASRLVFLQRL